MSTAQRRTIFQCSRCCSGKCCAGKLGWMTPGEWKSMNQTEYGRCSGCFTSPPIAFRTCHGKVQTDLFNCSEAILTVTRVLWHSDSCHHRVTFTVCILLNRSRQEQGFFCLLPSPRRLWGPSSLVSTGALSLAVERPGREVGHSSPSDDLVKNEWSCISTSTYVFMAWFLIEHGTTFFAFILSFLATFVFLTVCYCLACWILCRYCFCMYLSFKSR